MELHGVSQCSVSYSPLYIKIIHYTIYQRNDYKLIAGLV